MAKALKPKNISPKVKLSKFLIMEKQSKTQNIILICNYFAARALGSCDIFVSWCALFENNHRFLNRIMNIYI